jgi:proteasome assembly chaperone (PAC2) family protein
MDFVRWEDRPRLRRPVLVAAFEGWNDAGNAASAAAEHVTEAWHARGFATFDPEEFYDFTSARPMVHLEGGTTRHIVWPGTRLSAAGLQGTGRDVIILSAVEPHLRWRTYCTGVLDLARDLGVEMVVTLGALLADVPHSRPVRITGTAGDAALAARLGLQTSQYEGPTGIVGVLHDTCSKAGLASASLWAAVPHYVGQVPSPKATLALVRGLATLLGASVETGALGQEAEEYEREITERVDADEDIAAYVRQLEEAADLAEGQQSLPSVEHMVAEAERFLREQGRDS